MSRQGYTLLPTEERDYNDDSARFAFTYNAHLEQVTNNYRSIFTYNRDFERNHYETYEHVSPDRLFASICHYFLLFWSYLLLIITFPLTAWFCFKKIARHERIVLFRLGRLQSVKKPGIVCILPWIDKWKVVNILIRGFIIPPQQLILRDGSIVEIGGEIRFQVEDVVRSVTQVQDVDLSLRQLGQTLLTDILQQMALNEIETDKQSISAKLHNRLKEIVLKWGVNIMQVELAYPNVLHSASGKHCSILGMLMSSLQSVLQKNDLLGMHSAAKQSPLQQQTNFIHSFMTNTVFPTIMSSGVTCNQNAGSIYKLEIDGERGGIFWLNTKQGKTAVGDVTKDWGQPEVTVSMSDEDFIDIINSQMTPLQAYISGKLRIKGDAKLLYDLQTILEKLQTTISNVDSAGSSTDQQSFSSIRIV